MVEGFFEVNADDRFLKVVAMKSVRRGLDSSLDQHSRPLRDTLRHGKLIEDVSLPMERSNSQPWLSAEPPGRIFTVAGSWSAGRHLPASRGAGVPVLVTVQHSGLEDRGQDPVLDRPAELRSRRAIPEW